MGAGDELMVTGHVREMYLKDPRKVKLVYERQRHWNEVFDNNPKICHWNEPDNGYVQLYQPRVNGLRPYCSSKSSTRWTWKEYKPIPGELFFDGRELSFDQCEAKPCDVLLEPNMKGAASPNKDWGWDRWQRLAEMLVERGFTVAQVGPPKTKVLNGAKLVPTDNFRRAAAYIKTSCKAAVLPEGGLHHAAAAVGRKAIVIYGGYISPNQTGYDLHDNIFTGDEPCGWRSHCQHCADAMAKIEPEMVFERLKKLL
jgi:hypothetical protein